VTEILTRSSAVDEGPRDVPFVSFENVVKLSLDTVYPSQTHKALDIFGRSMHRLRDDIRL